MRKICVILLAGLIASAAPPEVVTAENVRPLQIPRLQHVWGRFAKGSSKTVRVVAESFDPAVHGSRTTITVTTTTLDKVDDSGVTLRLESAMEFGGKRLNSPPQVVEQGYNGQVLDQNIEVKPLDPQTITVGGRTISCEVWEVTANGPDVRRTNRIFYSASTPPYVLRRESSWAEVNRPAAVHETITEVIALDMPYRVLDELHTAAIERMVYKNGQGTTTTVSVTSADVPGGIVASTSKEVDTQGRLIRRSTLQLTEYAAESENEQGLRHRIFRRELLRGLRD